MTDLTFDHLPKAVAEIKAKIDTIEQLLLELLGKGGATSIQNEYVNIDEAAKILTLSKGFIYKLTCTMAIPHYKRGKRLYFSKQELNGLINKGRVKTNEEIERDAINYVAIRKRR